MLRRMYSFQEDYDTVKQICLCSSYRQVRSIVKAYNDEDFENLIHNERVIAEKIARNRRDERVILVSDVHQAMKNRLHYVMNPQERDYEPMKQVTQCVSSSSMIHRESI